MYFFYMILIFFSLNTQAEEILLYFHKDTNNMHLIKNEKIIKDFYFSYGKNKGPKRKWGDNKTPEGEYFVTEVYDKSYMKNVFGKKHRAYGSGALVLNYPTERQKALGFTGGGIWIHGTDYPYRLKKKNITKGCLILKNNDIIEILKYIKENTIVKVLID